MTLVGSIVARDTDSDNEVDQIIFTLANSLEGEAVDLTTTVDTNGDGVLSDEDSPEHTMVITFLDKTQRIEDLAWTKNEVGKGDGDDELETSEKFEITVELSGLTTALTEDNTFSLEVKPERGSAIVIERTIPAVVDDVMNLN